MSSRAQRLRPIRRVASPSGFRYERSGAPISDEDELARIEAIKIPPAWVDVEIAASSRAKVLARGRDAVGRIQTIYNPAFRRRRERQKFDSMRGFGGRLPTLRRQVERDLRRRSLNEAKVVATVIALIDRQFFRVGSPRSARENGAFGITTLRRRHTKVTRNSVKFDFVGKSGKPHHLTIRDPRLARIVGQLEEMPSYEIFRFFDEDGVLHNVHAHHVNDYVKRHMGGAYTAKDFRTWGGTVGALEALCDAGALESHSEIDRKRMTVSAVKAVAERLGNTPEVTRSSYIDPRILSVFSTDDGARRVKRMASRVRKRPHLSRSEQLTLRIMENEPNPL